MNGPAQHLAEKLRILQLETLYDLAMTLRAQRPEEEQVDELLQRVCAVLDPAAAVAVTRNAVGAPRASASVGWARAPEGEAILAEPLGERLLMAGKPVVLEDGTLLGRDYRQLLAVPLSHRELQMGFLAVVDKEVRAGDSSGAGAGRFSGEDRRFLDSVAALAGVSLAGARRLERAEAQRQRLAEENKVLKGRLQDELAGRRIVAHAPAMRRILGLVERVAQRGVSVLVRGDSGTGKELIAKLLHLLSERSGALVAVNCAAIPEALLESELFGIEGGVATGVSARAGKFELADGGTLFLDEIGDMAPAMQAKLLRVLQEREVVRVGGRRPVAVDVRLVAATHRDLQRMVRRREFRDDLYYRLKGVEIELPPLKDRRQDIPQLVRYFAEHFAAQEGIPTPAFHSDAVAMLLAHDFPGNVRELQNLVEGAVSLADAEVDAELMGSLLDGFEPDRSASLDLESAERRHISQVLRMTGGNKSAAARILGVDRRTLQRKGY